MLRPPTALAWESRSFFHALLSNTQNMICVKYICVESSRRVCRHRPFSRKTDNLIATHPTALQGSGNKPNIFVVASFFINDRIHKKYFLSSIFMLN